MPKRPYDSRRWRRLRARKLHADPLCQYCPLGTVTPATEVDHRVPIEQGGDPWDENNLVSTCKPCHLRKTRYLDQLGRDSMPSPKVKGVDAKTGMPVDPDHWWNKEKIRRS